MSKVKPQECRHAVNCSSHPAMLKRMFFHNVSYSAASSSAEIDTFITPSMKSCIKECSDLCAGTQLQSNRKLDRSFISYILCISFSSSFILKCN